MIPLKIVFGDGSTPEYAGRNIIQGKLDAVVGLDVGTAEGNPTVGFFIEMPDGSLVFTETTWNLFNAAHAACRGRFGPVL